MRARLFFHPSIVIRRVPHPRLISSVVYVKPDAPEPPQPGIPHFTFSEEPLGLPASEGFGYFQGGPGLGRPDRRFKLQAKLGFGTASSVWLARVSINDRHAAIKILTGNATRLNREHKLRELEVFQRLTSVTPKESSDHCVSLLTHFVHSGIEDDEEHLCLVTELLSSTIQAIQETLQNRHIPAGTVKRILRHVLLGIVHLHKRGIAHTDIKPDNIMIDLESRWTTDAIETWVKENPLVRTRLNAA